MAYSQKLGITYFGSLVFREAESNYLITFSLCENTQAGSPVPLNYQTSLQLTLPTGRGVMPLCRDGYKRGPQCRADVFGHRAEVRPAEPSAERGHRPEVAQTRGALALPERGSLPRRCRRNRRHGNRNHTPKRQFESRHDGFQSEDAGNRRAQNGGKTDHARTGRRAGACVSRQQLQRNNLRFRYKEFPRPEKRTDGDGKGAETGRPCGDTGVRHARE